MLTTLFSITTQQASPKENTMHKIHQFWDYAATHTDAIITFSAFNMVLAGYSNASYLSYSKAFSRADCHFFLLNNSTDPSKNGAVLTVT